MQLSTKFTLVMVGTVMFVVTALSCIFASQLLEQLIEEADTRAGDLAQQVFVQAKQSLVETAHPDRFDISEGLRTQLIAAKENPLVYEVAIVNTDGVVLVSSEENHQGKLLPRTAPLPQLVNRSLLYQLKVLSMPTRRTVKNPQLFEHSYYFANDNKPFGEVRVIVDSALLVQQIRSGLRAGGIFVLGAAEQYQKNMLFSDSASSALTKLSVMKFLK